LQNKSLSRLKYLNLSNNDITDVGLTYLNELSSLNELVLLNMNKLTDDYFLSLEKSGLISKLNIFKCDKTKLTFRYLDNKYTEFNLPNLNSVKIANNFTEVHRILTDLFLLDKLSSRIKILDLSNTGLTDNGMLRLTKNIHYFKNLESINLENSKVTACSLKYFKQIQEKNIKITPNITNIPSKVRKRAYNIILGGSTYSGKTSYLRTYFDKEFNPPNFSTTGGYYIDMDYPKLENTKVKIYDTNRWIGIGEHMVKDYIRLADGIILLSFKKRRF